MLVLNDSCRVLSVVIVLSLQEFCRLLKTVKVDVDSSGKKCKERMMKVLIETVSSSSCRNGCGSQTHDSDVADKWNFRSI